LANHGDIRSLAVPEGARPDRFASRSGMSYVGELLVVGVAYFLLAKLGLALASIHPSATPIWPPTGLALAAVMLRGQRVAPAIFVGALLANATTAGSLYSSAGIGLGNTLECMVGGWLVERWCDGRRAFNSPARIARFALISLAIAAPLSATIGIGSLALAGSIELGRSGSVWVTWWLGDVAGALLLTPVLVLWLATAPRLPRGKRLVEAAAAIVAACLAGIVVFGPFLEQTQPHAALGFLVIMPLMWAALRLGRRATATIALLLSCLAVWGTLQGVGPFVRPNLNESFLLLVMFVISTAVPSLALSADVAVRRRAEESLRSAHAALRGQVETGLTALEESRRSLAQARSMEAALRENEERLRLAIGIAGLGTWEYDIAGDVASWSEPIAAIFGRPGVTTVGYRDWSSQIHPDDREAVETAFRAALEKNADYNPEYRILRPDGSVRWIACHTKVLRDMDGKPLKLLGVGQDVTEQKEAAERQQLLIGELDHRVRNILAGAQSMLTLTARNTTSKDELATALQGRIAAMAQAHGLLTRGDWKGIDLADLLMKVLRPYRDAIELRGERGCVLPSRDAVGLALALHELATNAAKYGALSVAGGRIELAWQAAEDDASRVTLAWQERGGPPVRPPERRGFGSQLIQSAMSKVDLQFPETGVHCRFELKVGFGRGAEAPAMAPTPVRADRATPDAGKPLLGERVLIVEDEVLPMLALRSAVEEAGAEIAGTAATVAEAKALLARDPTLAVLDINLAGETSFSVAERLVERGVPLLFATGYDAAGLVPEHLKAVPTLQKPIDGATLVRRLADLAGASRGRPPA
jgi:PAS domain S-box-containing protein